MGFTIIFGSYSRRLALAILFTVVSCGTALVADASPVGLRFAGKADLSAFGAPATSTFEGSVTWDSLLECGPGGGGEGDFPLSSLDNGLPCVEATIRINSVSHDDFVLESSRLMLFPHGMALQLWFNPAADLDDADAPDVRVIELGLWSPVGSEDPVFPDIGRLPADLSFLPSLSDRSLTFSGTGCFHDDKCVQSSADTLTVVPEPASATLCLVALSAAGIWTNTRRPTLARADATRVASGVRRPSKEKARRATCGTRWSIRVHHSL